MTAIIEYVATGLDRSDIRELAYQRLGIARLRYGVPLIPLCEFVRRGDDRVAVTGSAAAFAKEDPIFRLTNHFKEYVEAALAAAAEAAAAIAAAAQAVDESAGATASPPP